MTTPTQGLTDPVCGMAIDAPANAVGSSEHMGQTYYFCSSDCKEQFDADPSRFVAA